MSKIKKAIKLTALMIGAFLALTALIVGIAVWMTNDLPETEPNDYEDIVAIGTRPSTRYSWPSKPLFDFYRITAAPLDSLNAWYGQAKVKDFSDQYPCEDVAPCQKYMWSDLEMIRTDSGKLLSVTLLELDSAWTRETHARKAFGQEGWYRKSDAPAATTYAYDLPGGEYYECAFDGTNEKLYMVHCTRKSY